MILQNKYVIGCLVMFYEIEMLQEYIGSIIGALREVENPENVTVVLDFSFQEYLETIDTEVITTRDIFDKFHDAIAELEKIVDVNVSIYNTENDFYNIAQHRRDLNDGWCQHVDFVIWGETDSLFPAETFDAIEAISRQASEENVNRYIINFADRKNWDASWDVITHPMFEKIDYADEVSWLTTNEASSKSYMSYQRMCEINNLADSYDIKALYEPKFDGSCLVISSELIKSGVNIPLAVTHCAEDTSFGKMAKLVCGQKYIQYVVKNILRVHNRRHPRKRMYIKNENNPMGFVGKSKGDWWNILEYTSKYNVDRLFNSQEKFKSLDDILSEIKKSRL